MTLEEALKVDLTSDILLKNGDQGVIMGYYHNLSLSFYMFLSFVLPQFECWPSKNDTYTKVSTQKSTDEGMNLAMEIRVIGVSSEAVSCLMPLMRI